MNNCMTEAEFSTLTFDGFKRKSERERQLLVERMSVDQFARWLDRCVPPEHRASMDSFASSVYRARRGPLTLQ